MPRWSVRRPWRPDFVARRWSCKTVTGPWTSTPMSLQVSARRYDKDGHRLNILSKKLCGLSSRVFQRMWELETSSMRLITIEWIIDRYQCSKDKDSQIVYAPTDRAR